MAMEKVIINAFTIWQVAMGKIRTFTMGNFTFPSFAAPNTSSATSCVKLFSCVLHVSPKGRPGVGRRWQMTMDKIIINTFTIWQMTMGKISTFVMNNFTFPSFAAPNTSSATSCVKLFSCVLHVSPKGRRGGTRVLPGPSLRCSKSPARPPPHSPRRLGSAA